MPLAELNERLAHLRARVSEQERLSHRRERVHQQCQELEGRVEELGEVLAGEQLDVDKLEGLSVAAIFAAILGDKPEKLRAERQEVVAAKLKLDEARAEATATERELGELDAQLAGLEQVGSEYTSALNEKQAWLSEHRRADAEPLFELAERQGRLEDLRRELLEAQEVGSDAQEELEACLAALRKAKDWGTFDVLGGGLVVTVVKHSHLDSAREAANQAQIALSCFSRELADTGAKGGFSVDLGGFEHFADFFFDNIFTDLMVQSKIDKAFVATEGAWKQVDLTLADLRARLEEAAAEEAEVKAERTRLVEEWS